MPKRVYLNSSDVNELAEIALRKQGEIVYAKNK